jgi:peptide/nickel transport system substrate-binding protein
MQAFESGQLQAGVVLDSHSDAEIKAKKIPTFASTHNSGVAILMNNREKSALHDVRLRQAIQLAFNPNVWNERNNAGEQIASDLLFMKGSLFYSEDEQKLPYDPAKAKQLVAQVKADTGWNGTLRWVGPSTQTNQPVILSSMLNPIGVKLDVTNLPVANFFTKVYVEHDFDLAGGGWGVAEAAPFGSLYASYVSPTNQIGYSDPQMTQIVNEMGAAGEPDQQKAVMKKYIARYVETAPVISCGTTTWNFFHKANVHGLAHVAGDMMQFDKAWVS